jgi:uncharacterized membrane protein
MLWLGLVARSFYQQHLGYLMTPSPNWFVAIIFYLLSVVGVLVSHISFIVSLISDSVTITGQQ